MTFTPAHRRKKDPLRRAQLAPRIRPARAWWLCPNDPPCPHGAAVHDVYDADDVTPRCCIDGCDCGATPRAEGASR